MAPTSSAKPTRIGTRSLALAGDNAVVVGLAAAGLPREQRRAAIMIGILGATALRIAFALVTTQLLAIVGLLLAGGILLLWVCWKMWRELRHAAKMDAGLVEGMSDEEIAEAKTLRQAVIQIIIADVSMSLDNVLAVAGAARERGDPGVRRRPLNRADGPRRHLDRATVRAAPMDRLCWPGHHPVRRAQDDLARRGGGLDRLRRRNNGERHRAERVLRPARNGPKSRDGSPEPAWPARGG